MKYASRPSNHRFQQKPCHRFISLFLPVFLLLLSSRPFHAAMDVIAPDPASSSTPVQQRSRFLPFDAPEKVVYRASWIGIPVAEARIKATPVWKRGKKFYATQVKAETLPYLDLIFRVRDTIQSVIDADTLKPYRFIYKQHENGETTNTMASYNPHEGKWTLNINKKKRVKHHELDFTDTLDPIAASYLVRSLDFKVGDRLNLMVFVGGKSRYPLTLKVVRKEMIAVGGSVFDAYRIISRVEMPAKKNKPSEFREARVWLSSDERRILLRATSQVLLGDFKIEMVSLQSGKPVRIKDLPI